MGKCLESVKTHLGRSENVEKAKTIKRAIIEAAKDRDIDASNAETISEALDIMSSNLPVNPANNGQGVA